MNVRQTTEAVNTDARTLKVVIGANATMVISFIPTNETV